MVTLILSIIWLILSVYLTHAFYSRAQNTGLMDKPNERSMHIIPTVRGGGLVFVCLSLLSWPILCYLNQSSMLEQWILISCIGLIAILSFMDDLYNLSMKLRFVLHCILALCVVISHRPLEIDLGLFSLSNPWLIVPILFIFLVAAINQFNFMDGLDGFCASQSMFLCAAYALFFHFHDAYLYQNFCLLLICSLIGFLHFNFPPAKLFMGDVGSTTLGFISFSLALIGQQEYQIPLWYWFILNSLFVFDCSITIIRRIIHKESWTSPHKKHAYQRLKQLRVDTSTILLGQAIINVSLYTGLILMPNTATGIQVLILSVISLLFTAYYRLEHFFPMFQGSEQTSRNLNSSS